MYGKKELKLIIENQIFETRINYKNINWYKLKGYDCRVGNKICVKLEDLPFKSRIYIKLKCDYCGKEFERRYADHTFIMSKDIKNNKDACNDCGKFKQEEILLEKYGVNNIFILEKTKIKIKETNLEKYGVENPMYSNEIKEKLKNSCIEKYGVDNPSKSEEVKQKIVDTIQERFGVNNIMDLQEYRFKIAETFSKNNTVSTSKQQIYLHRLFGGCLNYAVGTPILDIAFPENKIYIEYNGGGHNLCVKLGSISEKEFRNKEIRRYHYLKDKGWKAIFIDSDNDLLPQDEILINMFNKGIEYLLDGGIWIKFKINNDLVISDICKENMLYGTLRRIKEKDLIIS